MTDTDRLSVRYDTNDCYLIMLMYFVHDLHTIDFNCKVIVKICVCIIKY